MVAWNGLEDNIARASAISTSSTSRVGSVGPKGPSALWIFNFWQEVNFARTDEVAQFNSWPLIPISTNELVSCSLSAAVLYITEEQFNMSEYTKLTRDSSTCLSVAGNNNESGGNDGEISENESESSGVFGSSCMSEERRRVDAHGVDGARGHHEGAAGVSRNDVRVILQKLGVPMVCANFVARLDDSGGGVTPSLEAVRPCSDMQLPSRIIESLAILTANRKETLVMIPGSASSGSSKPSYQTTRDQWLKWEHLSMDERVRLLLFFSEQASVIGVYSLAERKTISQLPLFRTLVGSFVAIDGQEYYLLQSGTDPADLFLPLDDQV